MKRYKRIVVLLAVLAVACVATFAVSQYREYKEEIETSDEVILEIDPESVTTLSWSIDGQPLDTSLVDSYLSSLTNADLSEYVTYNATEEELEKYGMNDPELTVAVDYTYTDENDKEVSDSITVSIARAPGDGRTWMRWRRRVSPMIPAQMPLRTSLPTCGWASPRSFISSAATSSPP